MTAMAAVAAVAPAEVYAHGPGELQRAQAATERRTPHGHQWSSMVKDRCVGLSAGATWFHATASGVWV